MAQPVDFEYANMMLLAPNEATPEQCADLPCRFENGVYVSAWKLSAEELEHVNQTGVVWLQIAIPTAPPPVCISAKSPIDVVQNDGTVREPKTEPIQKKAPRNV